MYVTFSLFPSIFWIILLLLFSPFKIHARLDDEFLQNRRDKSCAVIAILMMGVSLQCMIDLVVAAISLIIGLGFFEFVAAVLCLAAFFYNSKQVS